jgi:FkbM family methyltransferase
MLPFKLDVTDDLSKWRAQTFWVKEPETLLWLQHFSNITNFSVKTLIDVGANIGIYSIYWLWLNSNKYCIAVEPSENNLKLLKKNLALNNFLYRVVIISNPLSQYDQLGNFRNEDLRPGSSQYQFIPSKTPNDLNKINSLQIDTIIKNRQENCILKIDIDGDDFNVLKGARETLQSGIIKSVLIESIAEVQVNIYKFLKKFGYVLDPKFNNLANHSDIRRVIDGNLVQNRIYSLKEML